MQKDRDAFFCEGVSPKIVRGAGCIFGAGKRGRKIDTESAKFRPAAIACRAGSMLPATTTCRRLVAGTRAVYPASQRADKQCLAPSR